MPEIKTHFRLNVLNGLFYVGQWNHYPSEDQIFKTLSNRFAGPFTINGEKITFQVEKLQFFDPYFLKVGDLVEVIQYFWFYDRAFEVGDQFVMSEEHVMNGFERFVKKVEG